MKAPSALVAQAGITSKIREKVAEIHGDVKLDPTIEKSMVANAMAAGANATEDWETDVDESVNKQVSSLRLKDKNLQIFRSKELERNPVEATKATMKPPIPIQSQADYSKLKPGDKYIWNGKLGTRGGK